MDKKMLFSFFKFLQCFITYTYKQSSFGQSPFSGQSSSLFAMALGDGPFSIAECLIKPTE